MTRRPTVLLAALAAAGLLLSGCSLSLQSLPKYSSQSGPFYHVYATFGNVLNLPEDADVRSGVATIGQVGSIQVKDFTARVRLDIKTTVKLPVGTRAEVQFDDPLGDEYVEMIPPARAAGGTLANGSVLTDAETSSAPSIADTLAALSTVLNGGGINQLHTIVGELDQTFKGNEPQIRDLIAQIQRTFGSLASHDNDIDAALTALANLSVQLNKGTPVIVAGIDALEPATTILADQNQELSGLLTSVNRLAATADNVADTSSEDTIADVHALEPVVSQLVGVDRQIGPALADISRFEQLTPKIAPGNSLQVSLTATAELGGSGSASLSAALQPGTGNPASTAVRSLLESSLP